MCWAVQGRVAGLLIFQEDHVADAVLAVLEQDDVTRLHGVGTCAIPRSSPVVS